MQLKDKLQKTAKITYSETNEQQTRYIVTQLEVSKQEKWYDWCFKDQNTAGRINVVFLMVINKGIRCASCI